MKDKVKFKYKCCNEWKSESYWERGNGKTMLEIKEKCSVKTELITEAIMMIQKDGTE